MLVFLYNNKFKSIQFMSNLGAKNMKKIMCYTFSEHFFKTMNANSQLHSQSALILHFVTLVEMYCTGFKIKIIIIHCMVFINIKIFILRNNFECNK